ncbi:MAG: bifunctional helix-turn-helix transcriptional regulator/GNAT family N-acetyltransferase [Candidatus Krumholzibacteriaceae bacterium]
MKRDPDILSELGALALASRLRRLSETMMAEGEELYRDLGTTFRPRWFPAFYALSRRSPLAVGELATELGITHTAVAKIADEMLAAGLIRIARDGRDDRRRRVFALTGRGLRTLRRLKPVWREIGRAVSEILTEADVDLLADVVRFEGAFARRSVVDRARERLRLDPRRRLEIVDYRPAYKKHFRSLNEEWLHEHFTIEKEDAAVLADPMGRVIRRGGCVLFALWDGEVAGTCAVMKHPNGLLELCKMAVTSDLRRRGIGAALVSAAMDRARAMGARELYLRTSLELEDAVRLYRRVGFKKVTRDPLGCCRMCRESITMKIDLVRKA